MGDEWDAFLMEYDGRLAWRSCCGSQTRAPGGGGRMRLLQPRCKGHREMTMVFLRWANLRRILTTDGQGWTRIRQRINYCGDALGESNLLVVVMYWDALWAGDSVVAAGSGWRGESVVVLPDIAVGP